MIIFYGEFEKVDFRSGTNVKAEIFPRTKKPAYIEVVCHDPEC